ncbi:conserved hypothetical protein [Culex quinquefasciatus]|uniref:Uncharacterized protein n=1 Tax=Culex quinquefasciatus TaxID=7176 RepID=B0WSK4_CULQU|nr:conserved hypothetical protein [Culex quinquefasciatus]|eukprot:XP_001852895.1 conserved hypothetical protein [Culex quinquefasciatus]
MGPSGQIGTPCQRTCAPTLDECPRTAHPGIWPRPGPARNRQRWLPPKVGMLCGSSSVPVDGATIHAYAGTGSGRYRSACFDWLVGGPHHPPPPPYGNSSARNKDDHTHNTSLDGVSTRTHEYDTTQQQQRSRSTQHSAAHTPESQIYTSVDVHDDDGEDRNVHLSATRNSQPVNLSFVGGLRYRNHISMLSSAASVPVSRYLLYGAAQGLCLRDQINKMPA